ncbi:MAG: hypothetical protein IJJ20_03410 [Thermoguttaceae bacterium]|nr:hypothetical protein [Thermoguttaceae bacterium]
MNERTDNNAKTTAVPPDSAPVRAIVETEVFERARRGGEAPAGFPWLLVIQIVLAIISYLIRRTPALAASDRSYLFDLKHKLEAGFPEVRAD